MKLSEWCKQKMEEAKDGEEAYAYHQLMEMWQRREEEFVRLDSRRRQADKSKTVEDKGG